VSLTILAVKPISALLANFLSGVFYSGNFLFKRLNVKNQGKCPTKVAAAVAIAP